MTIRVQLSIALLFLTANLAIYTHEKRPWTVLTYIAGDNTLEPFIQGDLDAMKAGANDNANILAFVSTHRQGQSKFSQQLIVTPNGINQDGPNLFNLDSGNPATAIQACSWAVTNFESNNFAFIFWNHGSGPLNRFRILGNTIKQWNTWANKATRLLMKEVYINNLSERGVCYDDTTNNYFTDLDVQTILNFLNKKLGKKIDIVAFDACLMAGIEIASTVKPYANYLVSSQQTIPGIGFDYKGIFASLNQKVLQPSDFAVAMVKAYDTLYQRTKEDYTLSAIDLSKIDALIQNVSNIANLLANCIANQSGHEVTSTITTSSNAKNSVRFEEQSYIDLLSLYLNLYKNLPQMQLDSDNTNAIRLLLNRGLALISNAVLAHVSSKNLVRAKGISIYMPQDQVDPSYTKLYWSSQSPQWLNFLNAYLN